MEVLSGGKNKYPMERALVGKVRLGCFGVVAHDIDIMCKMQKRPISVIPRVKLWLGIHVGSHQRKKIRFGRQVGAGGGSFSENVGVAWRL